MQTHLTDYLPAADLEHVLWRQADTVRVSAIAEEQKGGLRFVGEERWTKKNQVLRRHVMASSLPLFELMVLIKPDKSVEVLCEDCFDFEPGEYLTGEIPLFCDRCGANGGKAYEVVCESQTETPAPEPVTEEPLPELVGEELEAEHARLVADLKARTLAKYGPPKVLEPENMIYQRYEVGSKAKTVAFHRTADYTRVEIARREKELQAGAEKITGHLEHLASCKTTYQASKSPGLAVEVDNLEELIMSHLNAESVEKLYLEKLRQTLERLEHPDLVEQLPDQVCQLRSERKGKVHAVPNGSKYSRCSVTPSSSDVWIETPANVNCPACLYSLANSKTPAVVQTPEPVTRTEEAVLNILPFDTRRSGETLTVFQADCESQTNSQSTAYQGLEIRRSGFGGSIHLLEPGATNALCHHRPAYHSMGWTETKDPADCQRCIGLAEDRAKTSPADVCSEQTSETPSESFANPLRIENEVANQTESSVERWDLKPEFKAPDKKALKEALPGLVLQLLKGGPLEWEFIASHSPSCPAFVTGALLDLQEEGKVVSAERQAEADASGMPGRRYHVWGLPGSLPLDRPASYWDDCLDTLDSPQVQRRLARPAEALAYVDYVAEHRQDDLMCALEDVCEFNPAVAIEAFKKHVHLLFKSQVATLNRRLGLHLRIENESQTSSQDAVA